MKTLVFNNYSNDGLIHLVANKIVGFMARNDKRTTIYVQSTRVEGSEEWVVSNTEDEVKYILETFL